MKNNRTARGVVTVCRTAIDNMSQPVAIDTL